MQVQVASHQPQAESAVHVAQSPWPLHGSVVTQSDERYRQSEQAPASGPAGPPVMQVQLAAHQPQAARPVQSSQLHESSHGSAEAQADAYQTQSAHEPLAGPLQLPLMQVEVELHQPQAAVPVQASQSYVPAHSSAAHCKDSQSQSPHDPLLGPEDVPVRQDDVSLHQPQPATTVQVPHEPWLSQGSVVDPEQPLTYQTQSAQEPEVGPALPPVAQVPVARHQPQVATELHDAQSVLAAHGSVVAPQELTYQLQPEAQLPAVGPARAPVMQVAVAPHQPQLARPVQSAQLLASAQGSVVEPVVQLSSVQVNPEQQSAVAAHRSEPTWQAQ